MTYFAHEIKKENNWKPFCVLSKADKMRSIHTKEGVGDRLRIVAFAEIQARDGFLWAVKRFPLASKEWLQYWKTFAQMESQHAQVLLHRAEELEISLGERAVTDSLLQSFLQAKTPESFFYLIARAEKRGMEIGLSMVNVMQAIDKETAALFRICAEEEEEHIEVAKKLLKDYNWEELKLSAFSS